MFFDKITKIFPFILLLFIFSCGENKCSYLGDASVFQGEPQLPSDTPDWMSNLPKMLTSSVVDRLFGAVDGKIQSKGVIGARQMIVNAPQSVDVRLSPEKADLSKDKDRGTVYSMYAGIVRSPEYRATYYLGLTLYIVILGLTYLLGMTELTLQKSIPILIKVGVISLFTNPTLSGATGMPIGWSAYYNIIVSPSIYAMESFAMYFCSALFEMDINNINDGFAPLAIMMMFMFNNVFWAKMSVLIFSGAPMGFAAFIIMLVSMVIYMISAVLSLLSYMVIIATLGILFAIGPVFFIFLLFEKTKIYFDKWWKQILALMFQQYTLFIAISIFGFIIIKCAQAMLSFGVYCKTVISIKLISLIDIPLFYYYAADLGDSGMLTLAMYAIFFFMLTSIYATSIEKIADISSGLIEGVSGVGGMLGMTNNAWGKASSLMQEYGGNAVRNAYQSPERFIKTGVNAYSNVKDNITKLNDPNSSKWAKAGAVFGMTAGTLGGLVKDSNPFAGNTIKGADGKDKEKNALDRWGDYKSAAQSVFGASDKPTSTPPAPESPPSPAPATPPAPESSPSPSPATPTDSNTVANANPNSPLGGVSSQSSDTPQVTKFLSPSSDTFTFGNTNYDIPKDAYVIKDGAQMSMADYINSVKDSPNFDINGKLPENVIFSGAESGAGYEYGIGSGDRVGNGQQFTFAEMIENAKAPPSVEAPVGGGGSYT